MLFDTLHELFAEGGISVATPGEKPGELAALTLIQPDGDVVVRMTQACLEDDSLLMRHSAAVAARLSDLSVLTRAVTAVRSLAFAVGFSLSLLGVLRMADRPLEWHGVVMRHLLPGGLMLFAASGRLAVRLLGAVVLLRSKELSWRRR